MRARRETITDAAVAMFAVSMMLACRAINDIESC
jgi:hypothetical protein